jgi:methyl-accepting chemotaxis protein
MPREPESNLESIPRHRVGQGLRSRLWLACLSGGLIAAIGTLWITFTPGLAPADPVLYAWLAGIACAALLIGLVLGLWIEHHVIGQLSGILIGLRSNRAAELRGLPAETGWGELSELADAAQDLLEHRHREARAVADLERTREQLIVLQASIEHWQQTEQWERPALTGGEVIATGELLGHALQRRGMIDEQNRDAARQLAGELAGVVQDAVEAASHAERGFVEATSLQTSVRELSRLASELNAALEAVPAPVEPQGDSMAERARQALEELVEASSSSVSSLGLGLQRVQDVSDQVQRLANRATLIAIQGISGSATPAEFNDELKQLALDVRDATTRTQRYAEDIDEAVKAANDGMRQARERAMVHMSMPAPAAPAAPARAVDTQRLMERVLEMVQDTSTKGERVSTATEKASSVAERLARRLGSNVSDAQAMVVRLAPVGEAQEIPAPELRLVEGAASDPLQPMGEDASAPVARPGEEGQP